MTRAKLWAVVALEFRLGALTTGLATIRLHSENTDRDVPDTGIRSEDWDRF